MSNVWGRGLVQGLPRNTSLESLTPESYNDDAMSDKWGHGLCEGLARNTFSEITYTGN